jgi:exodeoxyribonuclease-3
LFRPESRRLYRAYLHLGFTDAFRALHPGVQAYTFWDYQAGAWQKNFGIRIDHLLLSPQAADRLEVTEIDRAQRGKEKASDHTPVWCALSGS